MLKFYVWEDAILQKSIFLKAPKKILMPISDYIIDETQTSYTKTVVIYGRNVEVSFDVIETISYDLEVFTTNLETRIEWVRQNKDLLDMELAAHYPGYLDDEEDWEENPISVEAFVSRIQLYGISFFHDLSFQVFYDDGDTYWGHSIIINVSVDYEIENSTIAG